LEVLSEEQTGGNPEPPLEEKIEEVSLNRSKPCASKHKLKTIAPDPITKLE